MISAAQVLVLSVAALLVPRAAAAPAPAPIVVQEAARAPYAIKNAQVDVTVGETVSRVVATYEFIYVRVYDSQDRRDPLLIDVPVVVRAADVEPGTVMKLTRVQLQIGKNAYQPHNVFVLDHESLEPAIWLPEGARVALVSFNVPRKNVKPRFRARVAFDQPHLAVAGGAELSILVPLLPDYDQLRDVLRFKQDDFRVAFSALPEVQLHRESVNAHVLEESPRTLIVHPRHRESIAVTVRPTSPAPPATPERTADVDPRS